MRALPSPRRSWNTSDLSFTAAANRSMPPIGSAARISASSAGAQLGPERCSTGRVAPMPHLELKMRCKRRPITDLTPPRLQRAPLRGRERSSAAAFACAIESSIVSGPIAAPATNTPGRDVAPMTP